MPSYLSAARRWAESSARPIRYAAATASDIVKNVLLEVRLALGTSPPLQRATGRLRILMVDDMVPDPLFGAGYPRAQAIVRSMVEAGHRVDFYPMQASRADLARMDTAFAGAVRFHSGARSSGLKRLLRREGDRFDLLFVSRPGPLQRLGQTRWRNDAVPVIYDAEAVLTPRETRRRALFGIAWSEADARDALEAEIAPVRAVQAVTAVGQEDADVIAAEADVPVFVLPHPVVVRTGRPGFAGRRDLLFVGRLTGDRTEFPNIDSVLWFATEVMPRLDRLIGTGYRLHLAGRVEAPAIAALASDRIVVHGVVENLRCLYDESLLFVAPTRYAAGIPLKVVEAMGEGLACVVTPLLARQLAVADGAVAIGEDADGFARECARLYRDADAWTAVRDAGTAHVRRTCSPAAFRQALNDVLARVVDRHSPEGLSHMRRVASNEDPVPLHADPDTDPGPSVRPERIG